MTGCHDPARSERERCSWKGKRATLDWLRSRICASSIPPGFGISLRHWREQREVMLDRVVDRLGNSMVAVRSDRSDEDSPNGSKAGHYQTCLDVRGSDRQHVGASIDAVFASYSHARSTDEVFVQSQVTPVRDATVAFTHALPDGAPYYALSIAHGPRSDGATRGDVAVDTWYLARDRVDMDRLPVRWHAYLEALIEVESVLGSSPCEVEMAATADGNIWLLQARPLAVPRRDEHAVIAIRRQTERRLEALSTQPPLLGMMPDWNPAELLGEHPRPLARDLFDSVIARRAWRIGRTTLGYARLDNARLLQVHAGRPYVDVRTSFQSLLPEGLPGSLHSRLATAWCDRLRTHPELHDKVEFEVAFTTLTCGLASRLEARYPGLLSKRERNLFLDALRAPTLAALDHARTARLRESFLRDLQSTPPSTDPARLRHWLTRLELRTAVRFASVARQAFAVEALLRSAVDSGALDASRLEELKREVTIAEDFHAAFEQAGTGNGIPGCRDHVRAGTFEIAVPTRREIGARLFLGAEPCTSGNARAVEPSPDEADRLRRALREINLDTPPRELFAHYRRLLHVRELGKFALARGVSFALDALTERAQELGIARDDAGWLGLSDLLDTDVVPPLGERIDRARETHSLEALLRMPLLIDETVLAAVHHTPSQANYLGRGRVNGAPLHIDTHTHPDRVPLHAIIAITNADPGFDWIFLCRPRALLTAYGGPNSHMAIRCAELGIPALLGVGPDVFRRLVANDHLSIDFESRTWTTP